MRFLMYPHQSIEDSHSPYDIVASQAVVQGGASYEITSSCVELS